MEPRRLIGVGLSVALFAGCGAAPHVAPTNTVNVGVDRARLGLHLSRLAEVVAARCPERSIAAISAAYELGTGVLPPCRDAAAYDEARAWLTALATETEADETRLWNLHQDTLASATFATAVGSCTEPDPRELRDALERATRLDALGDACEACGRAQREMLTALALDVLRRARSPEWSEREDLEQARALRPFSLGGPVAPEALFSNLHGEHVAECETLPRTSWATPDTWVRDTLLGSSAVVEGPPMVFAPGSLGFDGALLMVFAARMPVAQVTAALAARFQPMESLSRDPSSDAIWLEGIDGNSVALVLPGGRRQGGDDQLVLVAEVHPEAENAEAVIDGVLSMLASATRPSGAPALPDVPVVLDDPSLPWLLHQTVLMDAWLYLADPFGFVPGAAVEAVLVSRAATQPSCEIPSGFEGTADEMTAFGLPACAMFTQRAGHADGPWTHTLMIPRGEGGIMVAQTLLGDRDPALSRALARLSRMQLTEP